MCRCLRLSASIAFLFAGISFLSQRLRPKILFVVATVLEDRSAHLAQTGTHTPGTVIRANHGTPFTSEGQITVQFTVE